MTFDSIPTPPLTSPDSAVPDDVPLNIDHQLSSYDYHLPNDRIAQNPVTPRDRSRLLVVNSPTTHEHRIFRDLPHLLQPGDLLVLNNTRVIPARLYGRKIGGAMAELLLLEERGPNRWLSLVRPGRRLRPGAQINFGITEENQEPLLVGFVREVDPATSGRIIEFQVPEGRSLLSMLDELGQIPLPPYITESEADPEQYQTVYAQQPGAVAAPTAGLHFTPDLFEALTAAGIHHTYLTLHVGVGTFRPVEAETITQHQMHGEWADLSAETVEAIAQTVVV